MQVQEGHSMFLIRLLALMSEIRGLADFLPMAIYAMEVYSTKRANALSRLK